MLTLCTFLGFGSGAVTGFLAGFIAAGWLGLVLLTRRGDRP